MAVAGNGASSIYQAVAASLEASLSSDPAVRKNAEAFLQAQEAKQGFPTALLQLIAADQISVHVRQAASVLLKNMAKRKWDDFVESDKVQLKQVVVGVMLSSPIVVRRQLSEVLAIIAESEYPQRWPQLLPELAQKLMEMVGSTALQTHATAASGHSVSPEALQTSSLIAANARAGDPTLFLCLQGVLESLDALFERYRYRFRTDELFSEIKYSLEIIQEPLTLAFKVLCEIVFTSNFDFKMGDIIFGDISNVLNVFYSLNWQDLPEFFEDHMAEWMKLFLQFLSYECAAIEGSAEDTDPSCVDKVQAVILDICDLYERKYEEEFRPFLPGLISATWMLLVKRGNAVKYDSVATRGIAFMTTVSKSADYQLFGDPATLQQICEKIVIPNVELRDEDEEQFEDNPMEYVRRDMEGSDAESRRRSAVELVKGLTVHFEGPVTETFSSYVNSLLSQYASNPSSNWKLKDAAIYIVTALGWKYGSQSSGATHTNQLVDIVDFFKSQVAPELSSAAMRPNNLVTPILTADAIKFATMFRNQIPKALYADLLHLCIKLLSSQSIVVHTYAAICIERLLSVKDTVEAGAPSASVKMQRFTKGDLKPMIPALLSSSFALMGPGKPENEYVMKAVLRAIVVAQDAMGPHLSLILQVLRVSLEEACKNPANPRYNHYLFDSLASLVRHLAPINQEYLRVFEDCMFPTFQNILSSDIVEFGPYVLQILSQLIKSRTGDSTTLPAAYSILLAPLLMPTLWERTGYIPGMVQYIQAYVEKKPDAVLANNQLVAILGIFQKLIASKMNDQYGISLLGTCIEVYPLEKIKMYLPDIVKVLILRLQQAKTAKYSQKFMYIMSLMILRYGVDVIIAALDSLQAKLLYTLIEQVWLKDAAAITFPVDRKICAMGSSAIVTSNAFLSEPYSRQVAPLLNVTIALLEGIQVNPTESEHPDDQEDDALNEVGTDSADNAITFSQLAHASKGRFHDPFAKVNAKKFLTDSLTEMNKAHPGRLQQVMQELEPGAQQALASYLASSNETI